ncbi:MAG: GNAT family N-acetyltransferase [Candidatus Krumholzibacteria bacterium]|nr:GNAT family N-acetyltransferase [Candidatus Krumholzibacteria bacterium]MDH4336562.1 GNAT family N-acetyltransferase [Candidatus Krumholzibacteria bacterium]MDH5269643.1 GNAT family N-acetyltransferase [Candidatus Krumholzibacteria bacterium]MDH5627064.1 GNAT family N-acetyltransferase [Candidatus Krumholzibacteria bacterium]
MSNSQPIAVRAARMDDAERIAEYNRLLALESEDKVLDLNTLSAGVRRGLSHPELCRYFIATAGGTPVGTTMVTFELTDWRDGVLWWLQSVYVEPAFRRHGVFRAIYAFIEAEARRQGEVRGLRLYVHRTNQRAMRTYENVGMRKADYDLYEHDWSGAVRHADGR